MGSCLVKVARLQSEFCTKDYFFASHEFSYEKCSEIFPESFFEPLFCGSEKIPGKFPPNFPPNFPNFPEKIQKNSPTSFCRSAGRKIHAPSPQNRRSTSRVQNGGWCVLCLFLRLEQFAHHSPKNYHPMRRVFCGDGAWFAVPYQIGSESNRAI